MGILNKLFNKRKTIPEFDFIKSYPHKNAYFSRSKKWNWLNSEQISLVEKEENGKIKMTTMEYWSQEMFLDANGKTAIADYLTILIKQFQDNNMEIPDDLDIFMTETLWSLKTELKAIEFTDIPIELKEEFENPIKEK